MGFPAMEVNPSATVDASRYRSTSFASLFGEVCIQGIFFKGLCLFVCLFVFFLFFFCFFFFLGGSTGFFFIVCRRILLAFTMTVIA